MGEPSNPVKLATTVGVCAIAVAFLSLSFLGRYLEQRAIVAAAVPSLVSDVPRVSHAALELLRETVSPNRFKRYESMVFRRNQGLINQKWEDTSLPPSSLVELQEQIFRLKAASPHWGRELNNFERNRENRALNALTRLIYRDGEKIAGPMKEAVRELRAHRCDQASSALAKARKLQPEAESYDVAEHLTRLCHITAELRKSPTKAPTRVAALP